MTTEEMIEKIIDGGVKAYKKNSKGCKEWDMLNRHETVTIDGVNFNYWREYGVYKTAEYIKDLVPDCQIEVVLDGNNSYVYLIIDDDEQKKINVTLYKFLKERDWV